VDLSTVTAPNHYAIDRYNWVATHPEIVKTKGISAVEGVIIIKDVERVTFIADPNFAAAVFSHGSDISSGRIVESCIRVRVVGGEVVGVELAVREISKVCIAHHAIVNGNALIVGVGEIAVNIMLYTPDCTVGRKWIIGLSGKKLIKQKTSNGEYKFLHRCSVGKIE
jgi:hypothetical protein